MTIRDTLFDLFIISMMLIFVYLTYAIADWYRKRSSEFKKYGINTLEYNLTINDPSQEKVYQQIINWLTKIKAREIDSTSIEHIHAYHVNEWDSDDGLYYGWQKYLDFRIKPIGDKINVFISMTPSPDYQISPMGENVIVGLEKMVRKLMNEFNSSGIVSNFNDLSNKSYLQKMLDDYQRAYQRSGLFLIIFLCMMAVAFTMKPGSYTGLLLSVGLVGFMLDLFKFASDYDNYWAIKRKVKKEFGV